MPKLMGLAENLDFYSNYFRPNTQVIGCNNAIFVIKLSADYIREIRVKKATDERSVRWLIKK